MMTLFFPDEVMLPIDPPPPVCLVTTYTFPGLSILLVLIAFVIACSTYVYRC